MRKWLFVLLAFGLVSCAGRTSQSEEAGGTMHRYAIRLFDKEYGAAELKFDRVEESGYEQVPMTLTNGWWFAEIESKTDVRFRFIVGGRMYPDGGGNTLRTSFGEVWFKDGILTTHDPSVKVANEFAVLTLNLHTYQESDPLAKLGYIADTIAKADVPLVAFQECAQHRESNVIRQNYGIDIREGNMAEIVVRLLKERYGLDYRYYWNWAHYGWNVWEEGVAVLARSDYGIAAADSRYISTLSSPTTIDSRMAVLADVRIPQGGMLRVVSAHVSWGDPQSGQLDALAAYAKEGLPADSGGVLVCGDFNMQYESEGYERFAGGGWLDAYLAVNPRGGKDGSTGGGRIDYQFAGRGARFVPVLAQRVFTQVEDQDTAFRQVSDHFGVIVRYRTE